MCHYPFQLYGTTNCILFSSFVIDIIFFSSGEFCVLFSFVYHIINHYHKKYFLKITKNKIVNVKCIMKLIDYFNIVNITNHV